MQETSESWTSEKPPILTYPALYACADEASNSWQRWYHNLILGEYALLILAAVLALNLSNAPLYYWGYALVLVASLTVLLHRTSSKPEQAWYRCRAMAESVKTSTWTFVMKARPFAGDEAEARSELRARIGGLIKSNEHIIEKLHNVPADRAQTTREMEFVRAMTWQNRRDYYVRNRIIDQRTWYTRKAAHNDTLSWRWQVASVVVYVLAVAMAIARPAVPTIEVWPIEPLIVIAAALLGWVQIRKFSELASVYRLTALEIGLIEDRLHEVGDERELGEFVNEAELAFSREHTQWVARQTDRYMGGRSGG